MNEDSEKYSEEMSDETLIEALALFVEEYTQEAQSALWNEFRKRSLDEELIRERKESLRESLKESKKRENQRLRVVKNFPSRLYAEQAKEVLDREEIWCLISGSDIGVFGPGAGFGTGITDGVLLSVLEDDYKRALQLVESFFDHI